MAEFEVVDVVPLLRILDFCLAGIAISSWNNKVSIVSILTTFREEIEHKSNALTT